MLSRLLSPLHVARGLNTRFINVRECKNQLNIVNKRWSGHNTMDIRPSNADWKFAKNWFHFYALLGLIPVGIMTTILSIRDNPELSEVPDGYEPRHWEYFKHPLTRFAARYLIVSDEKDEEMIMGCLEYNSEKELLKKLAYRVEKVMSFYNDHRSKFFEPTFADYFRIGREHGFAGVFFEQSELGEYRDMAYDPNLDLIPTEGFLEGPEK